MKPSASPFLSARAKKASQDAGLADRMTSPVTASLRIKTSSNCEAEVHWQTHSLRPPRHENLGCLLHWLPLVATLIYITQYIILAPLLQRGW